MTILILLYIINPYIAVIPWWAWSLGWIKVIATTAGLAIQTREKLKIIKQNKALVTQVNAALAEARKADQPVYGVSQQMN